MAFSDWNAPAFGDRMAGIRTIVAQGHAMWANKDLRTTVISAAFVVMLIGIIMFFSFVEVPPANRDLIVAFTSMLVLGGANALKFLFGDEDTRVTKLERENETLRVELSAAKAQLDRLTAMLVQRHVIDGEGFEPQPQPRLENRS